MKDFNSIIRQSSSFESKFEVIAIGLGENLSDEIIKTLKKNELYYLNKNYTISSNKIKYIKQPKIYTFKNEQKEKIDINIHAIVGKNGTGKSTLIELIFIAINNVSNLANKNLSVQYKDIGDFTLYYRIDNKIFKISFEKSTYSTYVYKDTYFTLEKEDCLKNIDIENDFFYTIGINYSQHALNAKYHGEWLEKLFHKNDSYQTPIVIEPFRENGDIQINNQEDLLKSRLLVNILEPINKDLNFRQLTEYFKATNLEVEIIQNKVNNVYNDIGFDKYEEKYIEEITTLLLNTFEIKFTVNLATLELKYKTAILYIFKKLIKISITYKQYSEYVMDDNILKIKNPKEYFLRLYQDKSHITYKIRQAINFLHYKIYDKKYYNIGELSAIIAKILEDNNHERIDFLIPPSFCNSFIIFSKNEEKIYFNSLSSGEKQKIYSINSIIYHLTNLNSVAESFDKNLLKYRKVNIVLDEIELYFHPELQRTYIDYLIKVIQLLKEQDRLSNIESLNFIFVTHSPFILSDLINENVLFLDKDEKDEKTSVKAGTKTFGANIHDLLVNGFFIKDSIGKFSHIQIQRIINFYNEVFNMNENMNDKQKKEYKKRRGEFIFIINAIGESYLRGILNSYIEELDKYFGEYNEENELNEMLEKIQFPEDKIALKFFLSKLIKKHD